LLMARGEFSIVIAALAVASGFDDVGPLAAAYVLILAVVGPLAARFVDGFFKRATPAPRGAN
jgi:CPA2 family monovalent cation:H+ antiporter-2